jgi:elongator complex protein 3
MNFPKFVGQEILKKKPKTREEVLKLRDSLVKKHRPEKIPSLINILISLPSNKIELLKPLLLTKPTRTISGVTPVAVMTKPIPCPHGKCTYCPGGINSEFGDVPQSYTGGEPATMRGIRNNFDPYLQIFNRLEQYVLMGHTFDKIELIVMGGTFPSFPKKYQEDFIKFCFKAMNDFSDLFFNKKGKFNYPKFKEFFELPTENFGDKERTKKIQKKLLKIKEKSALKKEQERNETSKIRCIALCIETRPDYGMLEHGNQMLKLGCTRVELGIQSVYEDVLKEVHRGHTVKDTITSIKTLKDLGLKVAGHYMPGLPLTNLKRDLEGMKQLFSNEDFKPDMLKIYPTMVSKGTVLYDKYKKKEFKPLTTEQAAKLIVEFKKHVPGYCRIMRIQRDVPTQQWKAGVSLTNFRQYLFQNYDVKCNCIRCREPRGRKINWKNIKIKTNEYKASRGTEFFISAEDGNILIGFIRMRFPSEQLRKEITKKTALIRELHVYGTATALGKEGLVQHKGIGKQLLKEAESIAKQHNKNKIVITSGIGVRPYYYKLNYKKEGPYVSKTLK